MIITSHRQAQAELKAMHCTWLIAKHLLRSANRAKDKGRKAKAMSFINRARNQYLDTIIAVRIFLDQCEVRRRGVQELVHSAKLMRQMDRDRLARAVA